MWESIVLLMVLIAVIFFIAGIFTLGKNTRKTMLFKFILLLVVLGIFLFINDHWKLRSLHDYKDATAQVNIVVSLLSLVVVTILFNAPTYFGKLKGYRLTFKGQVIRSVVQLGTVSFSPAFYLWSKTDNSATLVDFACIFVAVMGVSVATIGIAFLPLLNHSLQRSLYTPTEFDNYFAEVLPELDGNQKEIVKLIQEEGFVSSKDLEDKGGKKALEGLKDYGIPFLIYEINGTYYYTFGEEKDINKSLIEGPLRDCNYFCYKGRHIVSYETIKEISRRTGASEKQIKLKIAKALQD